jgi:hypothetical protein
MEGLDGARAVNIEIVLGQNPRADSSGVFLFPVP